MLALLIIALLIGIAALAVGIALTINYKSMKSESEKLRNAIGFMEEDVKRNKENILKLQADLDAQRQNILDLSAQVAKLAKEKGGDGFIKEITYDAERDTVNIAGNLFVTGWVAAETKKED